MHTQIKIVFRLLIVSAVLLGALGSVRAQDENLTLLIVTQGEQPQLIQYDPVTRQEVVREIEPPGLFSETLAWNRSTLLTLSYAQVNTEPRTLKVIDIGTGETRCTLSISDLTIELAPHPALGEQTLAFFGTLEAVSGYYLMNVQTCALEQRAPLPARVVAPVIAPDAQHIAYFRAEETSDMMLNLYAEILSVSTGTITTLNEQAWTGNVELLWSATSSHLVYASETLQYLYDLTAGTSTLLSPNANGELFIGQYDADWSADGNLLLYSNTAGLPYVLNVASGEQQVVEQAQGQCLRFLPENTLVVSVACDGFGVVGLWVFNDGRVGDLLYQEVRLERSTPPYLLFYQEQELVRLDLRIREEQRFTLPEGRLFTAIDAAPDGQGIVLGNYNVVSPCYLLNGETRQLTENCAVQAVLRWSPDGRFLTYGEVDPAGGSASVYVYDAEQETAFPLTTFPWQGDTSEQVSWSPDGRFVLLSVPENEGVCLSLADITTGEAWSPYCGEARFFWLP